MYTTYITLIARRFAAELPVSLVKMISEMTKDREEIPIYIKDCVGHYRCRPRNRCSGQIIILCDTGRIHSMVSGYNTTFEDLLYPGQNLRSTLDDRQKSSDVYLTLRGYLYEINMFWRKYIDDYKKLNYFDYNVPPLILYSLPDLERIFETVEQGRMDHMFSKFFRKPFVGYPIGNSEIYLKPIYTTEELQSMWPNLFKDD